jgi:hypothetical protein
MRLALAIPISLILALPAAAQDAPVSVQVQTVPAAPAPSPLPPGATEAERRLFERAAPAARLMDAERQLIERAAREPSFAYAPPDPTVRSSRGMRSVTVYRGPNEAVTYRVPRSSRR